jgi:hypothetical protein
MVNDNGTAERSRLRGWGMVTARWIRNNFTAPFGLCVMMVAATEASPPAPTPVRYVTYAVSGTFQQGYKLSTDSRVAIDTTTGLVVDARVRVEGPGGFKEEFVGKPNYNMNAMWQWQNQGSAGGSLDFQDQQRTFIRYSGQHILTNSAFWTAVLGHNVTSSDTVFDPVGNYETSHLK